MPPNEKIIMTLKLNQYMKVFVHSYDNHAKKNKIMQHDIERKEQDEQMSKLHCQKMACKIIWQKNIMCCPGNDSYYW